MNRKTMIETINSFVDAEFQSEIAYYMSIGDREYEYDELYALFDYQTALEDWIADNPPPKYKRDYNRQLKMVRIVLIQIGFYRIIEKEELDNTYSTGSKYAFKMDGLCYVNDDSADDWLENKR